MPNRQKMYSFMFLRTKYTALSVLDILLFLL